MDAPWKNLAREFVLSARAHRTCALACAQPEDDACPLAEIHDLIERETALHEHSMGALRARMAIQQAVTAKLVRSRHDALSRAEVDEEVWLAVDHVAGRQGLEQQEGESWASWKRRIDALNAYVWAVWAENAGRIRQREPRYVEGLPARLLLRPPRVMPHRDRVRTGLEACLQCRAKGMECSRTVRRWRARETGRAACARCARAGARCLVRDAGSRWHFVGTASLGRASAQTASQDASGTAEEEAEMVGELERRLAGVRREVIGGRLCDVMVGRFALPSLGHWEVLRR